MAFSKTLSDVMPEKAFWFCNSTRASNVYQFLDTIEHTDDDVFEYHVTGKNDFAKWVKDVLEDDRLYALIEHERDKYWFVQKVKRHIARLEAEADEELQSQ